ncbi:2-oxo-4-hydroxy-4-carboxy-5-ureidoimidazoline decarboxylase [Jatrophihabitans sp. YIM 134969]
MTVSTVSGFDALAPDDARAVLAPCCASTAWQTLVVGRRPFGSLAAVEQASDAALVTLTWDDVLEALAAHPRIGQRATGDGVESRWSRGEQAAAATTDTSVAARLREANVGYEDRFGWVFLICATGKSPDEVLAAVTARMGNDVDAERVEVREQLRQIVRLRLGKVFEA